MKKRIFALGLCMALMLTMFPAVASAATKLDTPTGVSLVYDSGRTLLSAACDAVSNASAYSYAFYDSDGAQRASGYDLTLPLASGLVVPSNGEYSIQVIAKGDGTSYTDSDVASATFATNLDGTPYIVTQPSAQTVLTGGALQLAVEAKYGLNATVNDSSVLTFQWQKKDGETWKNVSGQTGAAFSKTAAIADSGVYRCAVTNEHGTAYTDSADVTVNKIKLAMPTGISLSSTGATISAAFTAVPDASGYKLSVQCISPTLGSTYGQNGSSSPVAVDNVLIADGIYSVSLTAYNTDKTNYDSSDSAITNFYYTVGGNKPYIVTQPQPATCDLWGDAHFSLDVGFGAHELNENDFFTYQWQLSMDGGEAWADIADETSRNLTVSGVSAAVNGDLYRCKVSYDSVLDPAEVTAITQPVSLTVTMPVSLVIAGAPAGTVGVGTAVNLTATLGGSPTLSSGNLVWYSNTENKMTGENVCQVADMTNTFSVDTTREGTMYYFCAWEDGGMAVYSNIITVTVSKMPYTITTGAVGNWTKGSSGGLSFTSNGSLDKYLKTQIDGKDVDAGNLTVESGSTIVTLKAAYLETLSAGTHTLRIVHKDGYAETTFTISASATASSTYVVPKTGDTSMAWLWAGIALTSIIGLGAVLVLNRKGQKAK